MSILLISLLVAIIFYVMNNKTEHFTTNEGHNIKQCNYNDKKLTKRCKEIRDGCSSLVVLEKEMKSNLSKGCDLRKDANTVRETISNRRDCVTDVERLLRTKYAKDELCAQIKNMPELIKVDNDVPDSKKVGSKKVESKKVVPKIIIPEILPYSKGTYSDINFQVINGLNL